MNVDLRNISLRRAYRSLQRLSVRTYDLAKYGSADMFNDIVIETTTHCNRRCGYCPNAVFDRGLKQHEQRMPEDLFMKIIDELNSIRFAGRISPHFYGEPLLDPRLSKLLRYAHQALPRATLKIYTNGDLLEIPVLNELYDAGVRRYVVSLHGDRAEQQVKMDRVRMLRDYIAKTGTNITIDVLDINHENTRLMNRGGLVKVKNRLDEMYCTTPHAPLTINYKGDVLLCCNDYLGQAPFGNLATESLFAIWNKERFRQLRAELRHGIVTLNMCKQCVS